VATDDVCFAGAFEQARLIRERELSAVELISLTLSEISRREPSLNAYRVVFAESAIAAAEAFDAGRHDDRALPLGGVPIAIKDDTDVAGAVTAWGTDTDLGICDSDAEVVMRLRAAGAIIIGKTNVPEMTAWPWTSSATWGVTRNPWDHTRTPGGSSGGSAVAVATGMCGVALGSDGGGSVRYPAALTGVFGFKPQRDRVPLSPHDGAWNGLLVYGPISRTVHDAAVFMDATAGTRLVETIDAPKRALRIAVACNAPRNSLVRLSNTAREAVDSTAQLLAGLGHTVVEHDVDYGTVMREATLRYAEGVRVDVGTRPNPEALEPSTRRLARMGRVVEKAARRAVSAEPTLAARINRVFDTADVLLTPMAGSPAPLADGPLGRGLLWSMRHSNVSAWAVPWNVIGQPAASVPVGFDADGLPLSVQLCGPRDSEALILNVSRQVECAHPWAHQRPPA